MGQKVRDGEELPEDRLKIFLDAKGLIELTQNDWEITQFSNGFSNLTYLIKSGVRELVLRRPPVGAIKRGHDMGREFKVLSRLHRVFPQAPKAHVYCEDEAVMDVPFYVMDKLEGIVLTDSELRNTEIDTLGFQNAAQSWLNTFVELHQIDYQSVGLSDLGRPEGYVSRQVSNWGKQYLRAATQEIPDANKVMTWLQDHQPLEYQHSLIHNDYKYNNVLYADRSWTEVVGVLDWEMCTLGDPMMDLGTSLSYWMMESDDEVLKRALSESTTMMPGNPSREELVQMYAEKSGRTINHLTFYYSYGLFKVAVIVQQIYFRFHKGYTTDKRFAHLDIATKALVEMAWRAIQLDRIS